MATGHPHTKDTHHAVVDAIVHICTATGCKENATEAMEALRAHLDLHGPDKTLEMLSHGLAEEHEHVFASLKALQEALDGTEEPVSHKTVAWMEKNPGIRTAMQTLVLAHGCGIH